ncbi:hypothetical protein PENSTE_c025G05147 [Penicillium steckii]|uniref:Uncharacterized protein n=1 Tax=Penicillium steckii TaxID=303698 RepID=A0A1V6SPX4_9EURO|nr:hypothetical protein PENSTE_c025G05147 [Penicillium steckii]
MTSFHTLTTSMKIANILFQHDRHPPPPPLPPPHQFGLVTADGADGGNASAPANHSRYRVESRGEEVEEGEGDGGGPVPFLLPGRPVGSKVQDSSSKFADSLFFCLWVGIPLFFSNATKNFVHTLLHWHILPDHHPRVNFHCSLWHNVLDLPFWCN